MKYVNINMVRKPYVAGYFYPRDREELIKMIEKCFLSKLGVGKLPERSYGEKKIIGAVVPHAGYMYSGYEASFVYYELSKQKKPETVIIIGPNHTGLGSMVSISYDDWETPLGVVEVDKEVVKFLAKTSGVLDINEDAFRYEHSIEVQIPWLQYIYGNDFKIVPICMMLQDLETAKAIGEAISKINKDIIILASSDFSHYEPADVAKDKDMSAIYHILNLDEKGFMKEVQMKNISICGYGPIATCIIASKLLGAKRARLLKYGNSGDVTGDYREVVAYASIIFEL